MDNVKGYSDALQIPDKLLRNTAEAFLMGIAQSGLLYGTEEQRQTIAYNGGNDPLGG